MNVPIIYRTYSHCSKANLPPRKHPLLSPLGLPTKLLAANLFLEETARIVLIECSSFHFAVHFSKHIVVPRAPSDSMIRRGIFQAGSRVASRTTTAASPVNSSFLLRQSPPSATASNVLRAWFSSYPSHEVVGLPALSPVRKKDFWERMRIRP